MATWSSEFQKLLLDAESFQEAVALFCQKRKTAAAPSPKPVSYADLSRRLGLRSRSHVREIIEGLKPTPKSFPVAVARALKLNSTWTRYLELLSLLGSPQPQTRRKAEIELSILKQKIHKAFARLTIDGPTDTAEQILREPDLPKIFAALGSVEVGATVLEIHTRTKISQNKIEACLTKLLEVGAVERKENRFLAVSPHLIFSGLGGAQYFQRDLVHTLDQAKYKIQNSGTGNKDCLFFNSSLCIQASDLPKLREEMRELLTKFVSASENDQGDQVINLLGCFF